MATAAQELLNEGMDTLLEVHGETWSFNGVEFSAVATRPLPDNPDLDGAVDRHLILEVFTSGLPATRPTRSDAVVRNGVTYTLTRNIDEDPTVLRSYMLVVYAGKAPTISTHPLTQTFTDGQATLTLAVVATGVPSPTYQWKKDGSAISGKTASTLPLLLLSASDAASYTVVVTNGFGSVTSNAAVLTLAP